MNESLDLAQLLTAVYVKEECMLPNLYVGE